jgi:AraC-like DNA-binding protein
MLGKIHENIRDFHIDGVASQANIGRHTREWVVADEQCPHMKNHRMWRAGISDAAYGFCFVREVNFSQVMVCTGGEGEVWLGSHWEPCTDGMAYLTPPDVAHAYRALAGTRWQLAWVIYENWSALNSTPVLPLSVPTLVKADVRFLRVTIQGLYREAIGPAHPEAMRHWAELVHLHAMRIAQREPDQSRLWHIWEAVDAEPWRPWNITTLARQAHMSGEHLRRICQKQLGRSPMQQVTYLRMQRAAMLLQSSEATVESVARAVGYDNPFAFSVAFKRWVGVSPGKYHRENVAR